jgi:hypothetical protein
MLLLSAVALALGTVALRDRRPTHAAQLANAGGLALVGIVAAPLLERLGLAGGGGAGLGLGAAASSSGGFGVLAYGAVDRRRGPVLVGLLCVAGFCASAADAGGLLGWPLVLALAAGFMLTVGLRPTTPAPPEPEPGEPADVTRIGRAMTDPQQLEDAIGRAEAGGPPRHRDKAAEQGKLPVRERIARLLDPGSFVEDALLANWEQDGLGADGVVTGMGHVDARPSPSWPTTRR